MSSLPKPILEPCAEGVPARPYLDSASPTMAQVIDYARSVAANDTTVLLEGETGTGKEVLAHFIHAESRRAGGQFLPINCGALSVHLAESELFGHERGAFSGAVERRVGYFEAARGGTLVLDEVSELPSPLQTRLLRVLQEREVLRVGASKPTPVDVRVIATTNRDLRQMVEAGEFRRDLFFRLNVFPLHIPPLRERLADLEPLVHVLVARVAAQLGKAPPELAADALARLARHGYPGNVRELSNVLERALILAGDGPVDASHVTFDSLGLAPIALPMTDRLSELERATILRVLGDCDGNRTHASRRLGISIRTLRNKLRDYRFRGIAVPEPLAART